MWITTFEPRPTAAARLFCFPFAGAGASAYRAWARDIGSDIEICAVQLPGREARIAEAPLDNAELIVARLMTELACRLDRPFALFGHSMGGVLAFHVARCLNGSEYEPVHLFVSGCRAPGVPSRGPLLHQLSEEELVRALRGLRGIPPEILDNPEFMEMFLPAMRSDCKVAETYRADGESVGCPMTAIGGQDDTSVSIGDLEPWARFTRGPFELRLIPGDHFFINSARQTVLSVVTTSVLADVAIAGRRG